MNHERKAKVRIESPFVTVQWYIREKPDSREPLEKSVSNPWTSGTESDETNALHPLLSARFRGALPFLLWTSVSEGGPLRPVSENSGRAKADLRGFRFSLRVLVYFTISRGVFPISQEA